MPLSSVASLAIRKTWMNPIFFFISGGSFDLNDVTGPAAPHSMTFRLRVSTRFHKGWHFRNIFFFCFFFFFPRNKRKNKRYIYFLYVNLFENECIFIDRNGIFSYLLQFSPWIDCGSLCKHSLNANFACRDQRKNRCILIEKNIHSVILKWSGGKWKRRSPKKKKKKRDNR